MASSMVPYYRNVDTVPPLRIRQARVPPPPKPYIEDFSVPAHYTAFPAVSFVGSPNLAGRPSAIQAKSYEQDVNNDKFPDLSDMPFLRAQILNEDFEKSSPGQEDSGQEISRIKRGRKRKFEAVTPPSSNPMSLGQRQHTSHTTTNVSKISESDYPWDKPPPVDAHRLQSVLHLIKPKIIYVRYECKEDCRSVGVCLHFSYLALGKALPDGLICQICRQSGIEESHRGPRLCIRHDRDSDSPKLLCHPEDVLASSDEMVAAIEYLRKAWTCDWDAKLATNRCAGDTLIANQPLQNSTIGVQVTSPATSTSTSTSTSNTYMPRPQGGCRIPDLEFGFEDLVNFDAMENVGNRVDSNPPKIWAGTQVKGSLMAWPAIDQCLNSEDVRKADGQALQLSPYDGPSLNWLLSQPLEI